MLVTAARFASLLLAATFVWAAAAKALGWRRWRDALARYRLGRAEALAAAAVPAAEAGVGALLLSGAYRPGAALAVALVSAFSFAVVRVRALEGDDLPCGCFGRVPVRHYRELLARNALLAGLAVVVLASSARTGLSAPGSSETLPAALATAGVVATAWLVRVAGTSLRRR
jgi:hypothetical protein